MLVDVHILRQPADREDWHKYCRESMEREPVVVHELDGEYGHIGRGRARGLTLGGQPYVAYVDPDDLVCRGAFEHCIDALERDPNAAVAYTREARISEGGCLIAEWDRKLYAPFFGTQDEALRAHHLCVYRRAALPDLGFLERFPHVPEQALKLAMWNNNFIFVDVVGYQWRQHSNGASHRKWELTEEMKTILHRQSGLWRRVV